MNHISNQMAAVIRSAHETPAIPTRVGAKTSFSRSAFSLSKSPDKNYNPVQSFPQLTTWQGPQLPLPWPWASFPVFSWPQPWVPLSCCV